ncbi:acylphosphatase [Globicatella sulfidifaciens]|uniref:acylphosphatase n=1 Tax=Globicatella sulfidifaciens TaxID=136093 RepID=A0A7X8C4V9_9LACT|nr:acylphosphatase [Globicatella sulfidifaciens]NLJ18735.1 hypothetical protein [Globicatella sulfidifaciens]
MNKPKENQYSTDQKSIENMLQTNLENMGLSVLNIDSYKMINTEGNRLLFLRSDSSSLGSLARTIARNKFLTKDFLKLAGLSVVQSELFENTEKDKAKAFARQLKSAVVKPLLGNQARGVTIGVETDAEFDLAWDDALKITKGKILIEENFTNGILARYLVVDGKCVSVVEFPYPCVIGNGKDTIEELITQKNECRKLNPHLSQGLIKISKTTSKYLKQQGYTLSSIPTNGTKVILDQKANPKIGSDTVDITDNVHPLFKRLAEKATNAIPGLTVSGIDMLALDHTKEPTTDNYSIIEMNNRPGLGGHIYTLYGYPRDVIKTIAQHMVNTLKIDNLTRTIKSSSTRTDKSLDYDAYVYQSKRLNHYEDTISSANKLLSQAFEKQGFETTSINDYLVFSFEDQFIIFNQTVSSNLSFFAQTMLQNKYWSRKFLEEDGLSIPEGKFFMTNQKEKAFRFANEYNMQVQLEYGNTKLAVYSTDDFNIAWDKITCIYNEHRTNRRLKKRGILITELSQDQVTARYLIIDGECVGVLQYNLTKDGVIETFNITNFVHPHFKRIAEKAAKSILGADIIGVEIVTKDHLRNPKEVGYAISDFIVKPSILEFHYPNYGEPLNIAALIVDYSVNWAKRKKHFSELIGQFEEAKIMPDQVLNSEIYQLRYIVSGKVQKVGFRKWLKKHATALGIDGYCKNRWDGKLEVVACSKMEDDLLKLNKLLHIGPRRSQVEKVSFKTSNKNIKPGFHIFK